MRVASQEPMLSVDLRGAYSLPIGDFGDNVESDFGFGLGAVVTLTPSLGVYGGWAKDSFGCDSALCDDDSQVHASGFELGGKLILSGQRRFLPWAKAGLIGHKLELDAGPFEFESDRKYGFQAAVGLDYPLGEVLSVSPALRFNSLSVDDDGFFEDPGVRYFSFDLGAHIHIPTN
jgi:hypothetical protein